MEQFFNNINGKALENFTPVSAFLGGTLIGLSASLLLLLNGRIAGISGIMANVLSVSKNDRVWRVLFLFGLVFGVVIYQLLTDDSLGVRQGYPVVLVVIGGFLVGVGTRMGSGCTSGHAVCGIANNFSLRSITATMIFMLSGMLTVYLVKLFSGAVQ